jgi:hypothetical protein
MGQHGKNLQLFNENETVTFRYLAAEFIQYNAAKGIESFSHVRFLAVQVIAAVITKHYYTAHRISSLRNAAGTGW